MSQQNSHQGRQQPQPAEEQLHEDEIDLRDLLQVILSGKWLIFGIALASLIAGMGYSYTQAPEYKANAMIQVEQEQSAIPGLQEIKSAMGGKETSTSAQTHIELMQSRHILGQIVDKLSLRIWAEPVYFPVAGEALVRLTNPHPRPAKPWMGLEGYAWGGERIRVKRLNLPPELRDESLILRAKENGAFTLRVFEGEQLLRGEVGELASAEYGQGNSVEVFVSELVARSGTRFRIGKTSRLGCIRSLRGRLSIQESGGGSRGGSGILEISLTGEDRSRIVDILNTLTRVYLRQNVEQQSAQAEERLKFLREQLPQVREQVERAEERLSEFQQKQSVLDLSNEAESLLNRFVELENKLSELELRASEMERRYSSKHPAMQSLQDKRQQLQKRKAELQRKMQQLPQTQQKLLSRKRNVEVRTKLYTSLLNKAQELKLIKAGTVGNVRIVDEAAAMPESIKPKKRMIGALSLVLGLFLGTGAVFVRRFLNPAIHEPEGLESRLGYPVYAVVPHSKSESKLHARARRHKGAHPVLALERPEDISVESLRSLRTSLKFAMVGTKSKSVLFTGAAPKMGKSFVSVNMAHLLAQTGERVLLLDCDLRKGVIHTYYGEGRSPGVSEFLAGTSGIQDVLHPGGEGKPAAVFSGNLPPNPSELLLSQRFLELLRWAEDNYDTVIIETPPVMVSADAATVAAQAGAVFMVVRAGMNTEQELGQSIKRLQQNQVEVAGFVFNDLGGKQSDKGYSSRYGGYYYYHYSYK